MCVFMCKFFWAGGQIISFYGSATSRSENSFSLQVFVPLNLRKRYLYSKWSTTLPSLKDSLQIFCFTTDQRSTLKGILKFLTASFHFASCFNKQISFDI